MSASKSRRLVPFARRGVPFPRCAGVSGVPFRYQVQPGAGQPLHLGPLPRPRVFRLLPVLPAEALQVPVSLGAPGRPARTLPLGLVDSAKPLKRREPGGVCLAMLSYVRNALRQNAKMPTWGAKALNAAFLCHPFQGRDENTHDSRGIKGGIFFVIFTVFSVLAIGAT
jgi:hypothetical protein